MYHEKNQSLSKTDYKNVSICKDCGAVIFWYETKKGKRFPTNVYDNMTIHRNGNYNNYVEFHKCNEWHKRQLYNNIKISDEIKGKCPSLMHQIALSVVLNYSDKIRSDFKKSMKEQAELFMNGKSKYKYPYSNIQAVFIIEEYLAVVE